MRVKSGKNEEGLIQINAKRERNNVIITIEDDGNGINVEKIKEKLLEKDILGQEEINKLTTHELYEYLTYPGFSTLKKAGKISGRGVGLDVVRNQIQKLKGDLRIYSHPGKMTRLMIRVPISITVTQAMLVKIDENTYAIPLLQVEETINISPDKLTVKNEEFFIHFRGGEIPVIHMSDLLRIQGKEKSSVSKGTVYPIIIVQDEGKKVGLLVDKIIQREEILIKNIGEILQRTKYILGGSIMENGSVVLVLDIPQIVFTNIRLKEKDTVAISSEPRRSILSTGQAKIRESKQTISIKRIEGRKPLILIVDDSLSVRKFLSGVLSKHKFEVDTAKNGQSALEMLTQKTYDLMITDLEMPQVSGYELIEQIRTDSQWDELPIIVLTGRASKHIQQHSMKLGANEFVIKPFKDKELLKKIFNYIEYEKG
jgi:chemosensory pili system protein ChpA (sensor histidine kinase/response regulator)